MNHLHTAPDEHLEARITAWILGEASPFEAAELEALCAADPELQLFANRTKALHSLLIDTQNSTSNHFWKLSPEKREKLDPIIGSNKSSSSPNSSIRRAAYRTAFGIAAVLTVTVFIKRFIIISPQMVEESPMIVTYESQSAPEPMRMLMDEATDSLPPMQEIASVEKKSKDIATSSSKRPSAPSSSNPQFLQSSRSLKGQGEGEGEGEGERSNRISSQEFKAKEEKPSSSMTKVVAAASNAPASIPVPDVAVTTPSMDFGDGKDFGGGWGSAEGNLGAGKKESLKSNGSLSYEGKLAEVEKGLRADTSKSLEDAPGNNSPEALVTGTRSGDHAIARESINGILNNPNRTALNENALLPASEGEAPVGGISLSENGFIQREIARRQNTVQDGDKALLTGREAYAKGDYSQAVDKYKEALSSVRDIPALSNRQESYSLHLSDASVAQAQQMRKVGKYDEARELLEQAKTLSPADKVIETELAFLEDPIRTNPAATFEHQGKVDEVRRNLYMAQGNYDLGKYDHAQKAYEETLRIDPHNEAARRGMDKIASTKSDYYRAAYGNTRAELLMEVDKDWELAIPANAAAAPIVDPFSALAQKGKDSVTSELDLYAQQSDPFAAKLGEAVGFVYYDSSIATEPKQIDIAAKHLEIAQENNNGYWSKTNISGTIFSGVETETLLPGNSSEYLYRGIDLGANLAEAAKAPLLGDIPLTGRLLKPAPPSLTDLSQEISSSEEPFSTFSLNISDASFQLALAAIEKGERPDPASIKPEQFYNAVDYGDPAPSASEPVAATIDQTAHPVIPGRNLVRVAVRTASTGRSAAQPLRLTLLVDQSGSMVRADRRAAMDIALAQLATLLTENDRITVIGFSRTPHLLADSLPGNEADKLPALINQTANESGTNLEQAINLASELALRHRLDGAQNRIVLFTDGAANLGDADPDRLSEKIKTLRQQNLAFDIAGIGTNDLNDRLLSDLARHGNGRYYLVGEKTANTLAAQLAGAFRPAAENVKIQVKLNPQRVGQYKLIGFEKDRLKTEDFRNDAVDAAELAADEAGVAIYQVETLPQGSGEIGEVSIRFRDTATDEMVERTYTIPYDSNSPSFDKANPKTQLATLALLAAQKLQPGPLADAINFSNYSQTIAQLKQTYTHSTKTQQLLNLINAIK